MQKNIKDQTKNLQDEATCKVMKENNRYHWRIIKILQGNMPAA